jgi:hypothetical protein
MMVEACPHATASMHTRKELYMLSSLEKSTYAEMESCALERSMHTRKELYMLSSLEKSAYAETESCALERITAVNN